MANILDALRGEDGNAEDPFAPSPASGSNRADEIVEDIVDQSPGSPTGQQNDTLITGQISSLGDIAFPVLGYGLDAVQSVIGQERPDDRLHRGIDIFADTGSTVVSMAGGTVIAIGEIDKGGMRVSIEDAQGNRYYYAHLSGYANGLKEGHTVVAGSPIGFVGTSGNAQGTHPHLHFSINEANGKPLIDPLQVLQNNQWIEIDEASLGPNGSKHDGDFETLSDEEAFGIATADLPFMLSFMEDPELQAIFTDAVTEGRTGDRVWIQQRLFETDWWKTRNAGQRLLAGLKATDPGEYNKRVIQMAKDVRAQYIQLGFNPPAGDPFGMLDASSPLFQQAETYLMTGFTGEDVAAVIQRAAIAGVEFDPLDPTPAGAMGSQMASIQTFARQYMVGISDAQAYEWSQKIAIGDLTVAGVEDSLRDMAMSRFAFDENMTNRMRAGFTPEQLLSGHTNQIAQTLGLDPDSIDLVNDPVYKKILTGGKNGSVMSVAESHKYIRGTDAGSKSREVQRDGAGVINGLMKTFGLRA